MRYGRCPRKQAIILNGGRNRRLLAQRAMVKAMRKPLYAPNIAETDARILAHWKKRCEEARHSSTHPSPSSFFREQVEEQLGNRIPKNTVKYRITRSN